MNTVSKLFPAPNAVRMEHALQDLVTSLNHLHQSILSRYQVNEQEVEIIRYLKEHDMKKMKEVGEFFNIKLSTLTSTIDKLEKLKLVKRKNSREDRRVIFIKPTAKGANLIQELAAPTQVLANKVAEEFNTADFNTLVKAFESMYQEIRNNQ